MTLVILWTLLGLFIGCLIGNAVNKNLCYRNVKYVLTNNIVHSKIVYMVRAILSIFFNHSTSGG